MEAIGSQQRTRTDTPRCCKNETHKIIIKNDDPIRSEIESNTLRAGKTSSPPNLIHAREGKLLGTKDGEDGFLHQGEGRIHQREQISQTHGSSVIRVWLNSACSCSGRRKPREKEHGGCGLYAAYVGAPDPLKLAPYASGAHRSRAQRVLQIARAPDAGHQTLA